MIIRYYYIYYQFKPHSIIYLINFHLCNHNSSHHISLESYPSSFTPHLPVTNLIPSLNRSFRFLLFPYPLTTMSQVIALHTPPSSSNYSTHSRRNRMFSHFIFLSVSFPHNHNTPSSFSPPLQSIPQKFSLACLQVTTLQSITIMFQLQPPKIIPV